MVKDVSNRQSLTMPIQEPVRAALKESGPSASSERAHVDWQTEQYSSKPWRLAGPPFGSVPVDTNSDPRLPKLIPPSSPGLPPQPYAAGPKNVTTPPRLDSLDVSRSFFSNPEAAQSGTIIPKPSVQVYTQFTPEDARRPVRSKSTPDFKAEALTDPVPDLPPLDASNQCQPTFSLYVLNYSNRMFFRFPKLSRRSSYFTSSSKSTFSYHSTQVYKPLHLRSWLSCC